MSDQNKVLKFKKRKSINIGVIIFLILFVYIAINVYIFLTKDQLTIYEVHEGSTAFDNRITALILRQEKLINSNKAGYVLYFQKDGARVAKDTSIYSITDNKIYDENSNEEAAIVLTDQNDAEIRHEIRNFQNSFTNDNYSKIYDFKENTQEIICDILNSSLISEKQDASSASGAVNTDESGIITYNMDNFETILPENVTTDLFRGTNYSKINLRTTDKINKNTPVYKMITSEKWNLVLQLKKDQYDKLKDKDKISFTILENDDQMTANLEISKKGSEYYGIITLDKDMANYLGERFIDIEINFDTAEGLKIPVSSIVEKELYEVPKDYFTKGGESKEEGLVIEVDGDDGDIRYPFVATDIYEEDDTYKYIDAQLFSSGTRVQPTKADTDQFILSKTKKFKGVYNVNLGYAVFKRIEILFQNKEYCIVKDSTKNGLSAYDHIVLDSKTAVEQKIID